jgi:hypothetical protein
MDNQCTLNQQPMNQPNQPPGSPKWDITFNLICIYVYLISILCVTSILLVIYCAFNTLFWFSKFFYLWRNVSVLIYHLQAFFFKCCQQLENKIIKINSWTSRLPHRYTYSYSIHRLTPIQHNQHSNNWFTSHRRIHKIQEFNSIANPSNRKHRRLHIFKSTL